MEPNEIKHFLVTLTVATGEVDVEPFDTDYGAARAAYAQAEQANGFEMKLDIALLSADSLETIKQTHSSYFNGNGSKSHRRSIARPYSCARRGRRFP